jgi:hypothetical protein
MVQLSANKAWFNCQRIRHIHIQGMAQLSANKACTYTRHGSTVSEQGTLEPTNSAVQQCNSATQERQPTPEHTRPGANTALLYKRSKLHAWYWIVCADHPGQHMTHVQPTHFILSSRKIFEKKKHGETYCSVAESMV